MFNLQLNYSALNELNVFLDAAGDAIAGRALGWSEIKNCFVSKSNSDEKLPLDVRNNFQKFLIF